MALPTLVGPAFLTDAAAELYEVPAGSIYHVKQITLYNQGGEARTVTFHNVAPEGSVSGANAFLHEASIPAGQSVQLDLDMAFDGHIYALADASGTVSYTIDGLLMDAADERGFFYRPRARTYLPTEADVIYEADGRSLLKHIVVCNSDDSSHDFSLWRSPDGEAVTEANLVISRTLDAHTSFFMSVVMTMADGAQLIGEADAASSVSIVASGVGEAA